MKLRLASFFLLPACGPVLLLVHIDSVQKTLCPLLLVLRNRILASDIFSASVHGWELAFLNFNIQNYHCNLKAWRPGKLHQLAYEHENFCNILLMLEDVMIHTPVSC